MTENTLSAQLAHLKGKERRYSSSDFEETFPEMLWRTANDAPDKGINLYDRLGVGSERRTYAELYTLVEAAAGKWLAAGLKPGERVLMSLPTSWEFISAWLGAVCMGAFPSAIAPVAGKLDEASNSVKKLLTFKEVIGASRLLASPTATQDLRSAFPESLGSIALSPEELFSMEPRSRPFRKPKSSEELAFMQFTSGSTGMPRSVEISHRMATRMVSAMYEAMSDVKKAPMREWLDIYSAWLPMHHDMGLVGCLLFAVANRLELSLMNPTTFLGRPLNYLKTVHEKRYVMVGPNFGYQFCADRLKPEDLDGLDLSKDSIAMTGSEMIRPETVKAFSALAEGTGFKERYFLAGYGMAEATLTSTYDEKGQGIRARAVPNSSEYISENKEVACCGVPITESEVKITDASSNTLRELEIGEVLVKGSGVFERYYENEEATAAAKLGEWLRTGDFGFIAEGELYIVGRIKEILIVRGENIMPHELEWHVEDAREQRVGGESSAAFSVAREGGSDEEVVLVVETNETDGEVLSAFEKVVRSRIGRALSLTISDFKFVKRGRLPRTTSGKIQRSKIKLDYIAGNLD